MPTNRRARRKSIAGNITDVQKRLRFLETRPAPSKLASKAVATKNIALRAIETELIADASVTTRTIGQSQVTNFSLSSVTDPDGPAVDTENIATGAVENNNLNGGITDSKISGMSSYKLIGLVEDSQIAGLSTTKLSGTITNDQLAGSITQDKIVSLPTTKLTETIVNAQIADLSVTTGKIQDSSITTEKIQNLSVTTGKIQDVAITTNKYAVRSIDNQRFALGNITEELFINGAVTESKIRAGAVTRLKIPVGGIEDVKIAAVAATKITGTVSPTIVSGLSNAFNTASVSGVGISRTMDPNGNYRALNITLSAGNGGNQIAIGNHTHSTISNHGHEVIFSSLFDSQQVGTAHGHPGIPPVYNFGGSHSHSWIAPFPIFGNVIISSTIRIKKDVSNYALNDPKNILNLKMKRYKYKNSKRGYHDATNREWMYGYIAEDLQELGVEEVLSYDKDGLPDGIDYGAFSMLILELAKVRQVEIDSLKEEIQRLKEKV